MGIDFTGSNLVSVLLLFTAGLVLIIKGGDLFVDAATWIAEASGIPKFIIGATVVSFATTLPEMLVSVFAALEGNADIAVGNAVGSVTGKHGFDYVSVAGLHELRNDTQAVRREGWNSAGDDCCAVWFYARRSAFCFRKCGYSGVFCNLPRRELNCRSPRTGK